MNNCDYVDSYYFVQLTHEYGTCIAAGLLYYYEQKFNCKNIYGNQKDIYYL